MMDRHFRTAPLEGNLPVILALIGIWRRNAMGWPTRALIPYDQRLHLFPDYIQQLDMESNGKGVERDGSSLVRPSAPVVWGGCGTASQHSFFQLLHQGTDTIPVDFLLAARPLDAPEDHHAILAANAVAQAAALAFGRPAADVETAMAASGVSTEDIHRLVPHRTLPGDRPSTTILYRQLDAMTLGAPGGPLRTQGVRRGCHLGPQPFRPVGRGVRQGPSAAGPAHAAGRSGNGGARQFLARIDRPSGQGLTASQHPAKPVGIEQGRRECLVAPRHPRS